MIHIGTKEVKISLCAVHMLLYKAYPQNSIKILLKLKTKFSRIARYRVSTQKAIAFLNVDNKVTEREIKETYL